jgi:hypothetical protein
MIDADPPTDAGNCCVPANHAETPPEVTAAINAVRRQRIAEALLGIAVAVAALGLVGATAWNTYRLRTLTQQSNQAQNFGLKAVECILDNFSDHRWSNQEFHDSLADFLHAPKTPHVPLPRLPTEEEFAADCGPFNRGESAGVTTTSR